MKKKNGRVENWESFEDAKKRIEAEQARKTNAKKSTKKSTKKTVKGK